ncbi:MAG: hypothetical protein ACHQUC_04035 [Chlamydiales bacterium]
MIGEGNRIWPGYVANIPLRVESDDDADTSSGEERDNSFSDDYFHSPHEHFRLYPPPSSKRDPPLCVELLNLTDSKKQRSYTYKRGDIDKNKRIFPQSTSSSTSVKELKAFEQAQTLLKQLAEETFGASSQESRPIAKERLKVVIGANKMRSVSQSCNRSLQETVNRLSQQSAAKTFGFFWEGVFQEKITGKNEWNPTSYERVNRFYRQYKRIDREGAKAFRTKLEGERAHLIPYRGIREAIRTSSHTASSTQELRARKVDATYLAILDNDSITLRARDGLGVFSHYDKLVQDNLTERGVLLQMGSCGYLFNRQNPNVQEDPNTSLASEIDLAVRDETAKFFGYGVYYPEPSMIVLIPEGTTTIPYSFEVEGDRHYNSPQESAVILRQVRRTFNASQDAVRFDKSGAITSQLRSKSEKPFAAHYDHFRKIVRWSERDLMRMRGLTQSHFHPNKWAKHLLEDLELPDEMTLMLNNRRITIPYRKIYEIVISLTSRLFSHYDVVSIAQNRLEKIRQLDDEAAFPHLFIKVLENYDPHLSPLPPYHRTRPDNGYQEVWGIFDQITSLDALKKALAKFISINEVTKIESAAKSSARSVLNLFKERFVLDFPSLSLALMEDYIFSLTELDFPFETTTVNQYVLFNQALDVDEGLTPKFLDLLLSVQQQDAFSTTPLHWAAITGNRIFIQKLKEKALEKQAAFEGEKQAKRKIGKNGKKYQRFKREYKTLRSFLNLEATMEGGATPFHCAVKYCGDNANDLKLLEALIDPTLVDASTLVDKPTKDGISPLVLVLNELERPGPVVDLILKRSKKYEEHLSLHQIFVNLLNSLHRLECRETMLLTLLYHLPTLIERETALNFIKQLIKDGLKVDWSGFLLRTHHPLVDLGAAPDSLPFDTFHAIESRTDKQMVNPIDLAISIGDSELVTLMMKHGADVSGIHEEDIDELLFLASKQVDSPKLDMLVEVLYDNDANIDKKKWLYHGVLARNSFHPLFFEADRRCIGEFLGYNSDETSSSDDFYSTTDETSESSASESDNG